MVSWTKVIVHLLTYRQLLEAAWVTMGKKLIASIGLSPVVQKEIIDGHIFTMQQRLFQKLFV